MAAADRIIIDTGPLVGFLDESDQWHAWGKARFAELPSPMLTCEPVLSEASYLLEGQSDRLFEMIDLGALEIVPLFPAHNARIRTLMHSYAPRMQLADACLVRLSELYPAARVLTTDGADFRIYRRNRTEKIPLILP
jgi:predicted nucleic acid-binding protein